MFTPRRIAVYVIVLACLVGLGTWIFGRPSTSSKPPVKGGVLGITAGPATRSPLSSASPSPTAAATPAPTNTASVPPASTSSAPQAANGPTTTTPNCSAVARQATLLLDSASYRQGQTLNAKTWINNNGVTCTLTNRTVVLSITNSSGTVVAQQTVTVSNSTIWTPQQVLVATLSWNTSATPPGSYTTSASWPGVSLLHVSFSVTAPLSCPASDFLVSLSIPNTSVSAGNNVNMNGSVKNNSADTCVLDDTTSIVVKDDSGHIVFAAGLGVTKNDEVWSPGQILSFPYFWDQTTCSGTSCGPVPRGTYSVTFTDQTHSVSVGPATITLT